MLAVVEINSRQYLVKEGDILEVERLKQKDKDLVLDKVLLLADNGKVKIGSPYIERAKVKIEVKEEKKGKKIIIYKYKRRKKYRKKRGQRQIYTVIKIKKIEV